MIWGGGLSGSIPLAAAGQKGIALDSTLFSSTNFIISGCLLIAIPLFCSLLIPAEEERWQAFEPTDDEREPNDPPDVTGAGPAGLAAAVLTVIALGLSFGVESFGAALGMLLNAAIVGAVTHRIVTLLVRRTEPGPATSTPASRLENSELIVVGLCVVALGQVQAEFFRGTFSLSFNNLNYVFLFGGLLFQGTPIRYVRAVAEATRGCAGIILQFPLYFGILGIMIATGLGAVISITMANAAGEATYPILTYLSAGLVNLFVPSGGGQWVVQGTIIIEGAAAFPALIPKSVLALAYGDALTNMLQPFWAVPLLAITRLQAREIIGYTAAVMVLGAGLTIGLLLVL